jgi:hypothetical protein
MFPIELKTEKIKVEILGLLYVEDAEQRDCGLECD